MHYTKFIKYLLTSVMIGISPLQADPLETESKELLDIQHRWAPLNYAAKVNDDVISKMKALAEQTHQLTKAEPDNVNYLIWDGIVHSSLAKLAGGLGALSKVEIAKEQFEKALEIDPQALNGSAYASLGVLYQKVPGWPLGFGNDKKAKQYLEQALEMNPNGLDINYFYADYLAEQDEDEQALKYLEKALAAPKLINRPIADEGRRAEATRLLKQLNDELSESES